MLTPFFYFELAYLIEGRGLWSVGLIYEWEDK